jgi:antitoxin VapB
MALSIKHPEADRLARQLAERTGETITEAVLAALRERLARESGRRERDDEEERIMTIVRRFSQLPVVDARSPEELVGYDDRGLPE